MKYLTSIKENTRGEMLISPFVKIMVIIFIFLIVLEFMALIPHKQDIDYISKQIAKSIEQDGQFTSETMAYLDELNAQCNTNASIFIEPDTWYDRSSGKIQFRNKFVVTVRDRHEMIIATPIAGDPITASFDIVSKAAGRSEVYWKD